MRILAISTACMLALRAALAQAEENDPSIADFDFFIGEWEGRSTFFFPRDQDREQMQEDVSAICKYILKETYIQCDTSWTRPDGRTRTFRLHFNYNQVDEGYQTLFVYDNWPRHVSYLLHYDEKENAYLGRSTFEDSEGVTGKERIEWRISADRREIRSREFVQLDSEPDDYWPQTFEFVWRRKD